MIKPIPDFGGYFISDDGKVLCNLGKGNRNRDRTVEMYEVTPRLTKNGYARVYLRSSSTWERKDKYIHRLVAEAFIENPDQKKYVNHKNFNRMDNRASNLEWCSAAENTAYTRNVGHIVRDQFGRFKSNFTYEVGVRE